MIAYKRKFNMSLAPVKMKRVISKLTAADGSLLYYNSDVEAPDSWSQTAIDIFAQKYFRKKGVPSVTIRVPSPGVPEFLQRNIPSAAATYTEGERSVAKVVHRVAGAWVRSMWGTIIDRSREDIALDVYSDITYTLLNQMWAPNSPQWFNTGLYWAYGIEGKSEGHWHEKERDSIEVVESKDKYSRPQCHACFILNVEDNLVDEEGIFDLITREARLFKLGSGSGANYSNIRSRNAPLSGGGTSSGLMSFLKIPDTAAGAIKSGGTTRRAARMVSLDIAHPESPEFITWKAEEEAKAMCLHLGSRELNRIVRIVYAIMAGGPEGDVPQEDHYYVTRAPAKLVNRVVLAYKAGLDIKDLLCADMTLDWESEAYRTISGQNSNNSIRLTDSFMDIIKGELVDHKCIRRQFMHLSRLTNAPTKESTYASLWGKITTSAWLCGDPGIQFHTTTNAGNTCPNSGVIKGSNPCSEYLWFNNTACNLASINLSKCLTEEFEVDTERLRDLTCLITVVLDNTVSYAQYPYKKAAEESLKYRTIGLGVSDLGGMLMSMGVAYDSVRGRSISAHTMALVHGHAVKMSMSLANSEGGFPEFTKNKEEYARVLGQSSRALHQIPMPSDTSVGLTRLRTAARILWRNVMGVVEGNYFYMRNAQVTAIAPTGTISMIMDCCANSVEPTYSLVTYKRLAGGGSVKLLSKSLALGLSRVPTPLSPEDISSIGTQILDRGASIADFEDVLGDYMSVFHCAMDISSKGHIDMCAALQPFVSGGISKTINMPRDASLSDVSDALMYAWSSGLKNVTLYRDGSKFSQPLNTSSAQLLGLEGNSIRQLHSYKPVLSTHGPDATPPAVVSKRRGLPSIRGGKTHKIRTGGMKFYLRTGLYPDGSLGEIFLSTAKSGSTLRGILDAFALSVSVGLQYGVPLSTFASAYIGTSFEPNGFVPDHPSIKMCDSILDAVFKILLKEHPSPEAPPVIDTTSADVSVAAPSLTQTSLLGEACSHCGHFKLIRNGSCKICTNCGTSTGCS